MKIDRNHIKEVFEEYVRDYDLSDEKIRLKAEHTCRVAEDAEEIARSLSLSEADIDIAWLMGMLHDIGRFEQLRRFGTFVDADSIDHANFGADLLFHEGLIREFLPVRYEYNLLEKAVRYHSVYLLPEELSDRERRFCEILRDADKIDIMKVNVEHSFSSILDIPEEEIRGADLTDEVVQDSREHHAVLRAHRKTPADAVVSQISMAYELVFPKSVEMILSQGNLKKLTEYSFTNERTKEIFRDLSEELFSELSKR